MEVLLHELFTEFGSKLDSVAFIYLHHHICTIFTHAISYLHHHICTVISYHIVLSSYCYISYKIIAGFSLGQLQRIVQLLSKTALCCLDICFYNSKPSLFSSEFFCSSPEDCAALKLRQRNRITSANTPWLVTGYGKYGLIFCTWRIWVMEKFEIFHDPSPARGYLRLIPRQYMFECNFIRLSFITISRQLDFTAEYGLIFGSWSLLPNMD